MEELSGKPYQEVASGKGSCGERKKLQGADVTAVTGEATACVPDFAGQRLERARTALTALEAS
ncbi:hypothetical protein [Streptomyces erythrochromogenes]|uniref:hypothetical protein n=1 Tax=Streptomyces erythrochromogenes TaxID=285574 RepID=UPI003404A289